MLRGVADRINAGKIDNGLETTIFIDYLTFNLLRAVVFAKFSVANICAPFEHSNAQNFRVCENCYMHGKFLYLCTNCNADLFWDYMW